MRTYFDNKGKTVDRSNTSKTVFNLPKATTQRCFPLFFLLSQTPTPATVGPAKYHTQPQTTRFVKAPRNHFTCAPPPLLSAGEAGGVRPQTITHWSANSLWTLPVLCAVKFEPTGNIFFLLSWAKTTKWVRQRDEREMSGSLTWTIISFCVIRNEWPEFGPPGLVAEAWSPQTEGMFNEQYAKQELRAVYPMTVNICSTSAKRYTATETQLEEIYCTLGLNVSM